MCFSITDKNEFLSLNYKKTDFFFFLSHRQSERSFFPFPSGLTRPYCNTYCTLIYLIKFKILNIFLQLYVLRIVERLIRSGGKGGLDEVLGGLKPPKSPSIFTTDCTRTMNKRHWEISWERYWSFFPLWSWMFFLTIQIILSSNIFARWSFSSSLLRTKTWPNARISEMRLTNLCLLNAQCVGN